MQEPQMRAGTHVHFLLWCKHAVLHAQNDRRGVGPIETCNYDAKLAILNAHNHR